ncbi:hypothetical protein OROHE_004917 [Orobanche hederae]
MSGDNTPPPTPKIEINSPFFLGPQDRPGDFITPARFNGENYDEWAGEIETALQARRKFGFLDGTITSPEPPCTQSDWTTIHAMLVSWIMNTIAPEVKITLSKYKDAKRLWDNLKERFALVNGPRIQQVKSAIARCEQTKTMTVASYYGKLTALWEELHTHEPLITCSCCNQCSAGRDHETRRANDMLHEFLMGLYTEFYGQIRSNILSQDPLPSLNRAYQLVVQDERVRTASARTEEKPEIVSFAVRTGGRGRGRVERPDKSKSFCTHCKKNGHEITQCFEKIGYPDWWEDRSRTDGGTGRGRQSSTTGRGRTGGNVIHANAAVTSIDGVPGRETLATPSTQLFSEDQWKALASVFGNLTLSNDRLSGKFNGNLWIIDTGASNHVTGNLSLLFDVKNIVCIVGLPDGKKVRAIKEGSVQLSNTITLNHVLYVPRLNCSLLSVSQLCDDLQSRVIFDSQKCAIQDQMRELIGMGSKRDGLYYFKEESLINTVKVDKEISDLVMWHNRMGHPSEKVVKLLAPVRNCRGSLNKACEVCFRAKNPRDSFPLSDSKSSRIFELVHVDLWGPYRHKSSCGARYFLTIVDDFSRAVWVYLLVDKTEVFKMFMSFIAMVERQFSQTIKIVRSDNGTEFNCLLDYFSASGILFQTSCVGTPQQNGRVERKHKHLLNVARALRFQANLPIYFWGESVLAAAHLINRTPSSVLSNHTPFEKLFGYSPFYNAIRVFGSLCFAHNQNSKGDKFESRSRKCIFVGYPFGKKGWKLYDLDTNDFFISRDVNFFEDIFPFSDTKASNLKPNTHFESDVEVHFDFADFPVDHHDTHVSPVSPHITNSNGDEPQPIEFPPMESVSTDPVATVENLETSNNHTTAVDLTNSQNDKLGRGMRTKTPSVLLRDYVTNKVVKESPSPGASSPPQHTSGTPFPMAHYISCDNFSQPYQKFLAAVITGDEPRSFKEAMKNDGWKQAMQEEIKALEDNGTWTLEHLPPGKRALGNQWVYRRKYHSSGALERLKARLVVFGNHQIEGLDYNETFAPVAKMATIRVFLAIAATKNWELHQMDVHNAFLHGDLDEEVYMKLPLGFESSDPNLVCRLRKSLYGLKQAPRCWFAKLVTALKGYGFLQSYSDYSLFTYAKDGIQLNVLVYVDDLIISGNHSVALRSFKAYLSDCFRMKDLGPLKYFLGIEVARSTSGLFLCQRKYTLDIITEAGLLGAKPATFPIEQNHKLGLATGAKLTDKESYRRLVGRLVYLSVTRPDLAYSVHILSQFMQEPRQEHWDAALRVVRYLKGTPGQGILLSADCDLSLQGWCDSDWASCPLTRRSLTGWLVFLGQSPISWKTKKQHTVSKSSAEAEYRAMAAITCELKWLKGLLLSLGVHHSKAIPLFCDSQSALHIARNPVYHERTKHIEVDCHFVRDAITKGLIDPSYVHTKAQLADIFTKALGKREFDILINKLGILNPHAPT